MPHSPVNPFDDQVGEFVRNAAKDILSDLKKSLSGGKKRRKKRDRQAGGSTIVEVMASGLCEKISKQDLEREMQSLCKSKILHDLAEFEILETRVVNRWLVIFHFTFLSPLPPEAALYETEVALNQEDDGFGLIASRVSVYG